MSVSVDGLSDAIMDVLMDYCEEEEEIIDDGLDKISQEVVNSLKSDPVIPERTKKYKKSFYYKKVAKGLGFKRNVVANKRYSLTHLLERPHLTRNGTTRTRAFPHWETAQRKLEELMDRLEKKL